MNRIAAAAYKLRSRLTSGEKAPSLLARASAGMTPGGRMPLKEQIFFAKRLAFLVKAGVPLIEALHIIRAQTKKLGRIRVYDAVISDIASGQYLSTSLAKFKNMFNDFAVNLIRVGETSGILNQNLTYLADELAKKDVLKKKVIGALIYPIFITVATLGITALLTVYIFPKIMPIFTSLHVKLPWTTRALIGVSAYLREWGLLTLLVVALSFIGFLVVRARFTRIRYASDRTLLALPLAGSIARSYNLANFCRTLGLMLKSGVPIATALEVTADTTQNLVYRQALKEVATMIVRGEPLSRGLALYPAIFPDMCTHLISVGETTGNLAQTLMYLAELYELEVEDLTKNLSSSIEPILMLVMGLIVGLIAVSVITPIYEITQHLNAR